jgi:lipopolysaccharide transport system ATP-binding protein
VVRLAFAVAINVDPQILVVDEALSVGDELFQRKCFSRIEEIKRAGATILFVSHAAGAVVELCDRAVLLDEGDMLALGDPKSIIGQYQRLIYAPPERHADVRAGIMSSRAAAVQQRPAVPQVAGAPAAAAVGGDEMEEYFDPGLVPASTLAYEPRGARIEAPEIVNAAGAKVNCLVRGRGYRYRFSVRFEESASAVRFGMLVKSLSGLELGGAATSSAPQDSISVVTAGSVVDVEFSFRCALNPGTYFMNAGALGRRGSEEIFLHRILDVFAFRVLPVKGSIATGIVDLGVEPRVTVVPQGVSREAR